MQHVLQHNLCMASLSINRELIDELLLLLDQHNLLLQTLGKALSAATVSPSFKQPQQPWGAEEECRQEDKEITSPV